MKKKYSADDQGHVRVHGGPVARSFLTALFGELKGKTMQLSIDKYGSVTADVSEPEKQKTKKTVKANAETQEVDNG